MQARSSRQARGEVAQVGVRRRTLERMLESHGRHLDRWKAVLRQELPAVAADARDIVEDGVDCVARAVGVAVVQASAATVRGIESALGRLQRGTYGSCEDCGGRIPSARLRVLPFAQRCRECQQQVEGSEDLGSGWPLASC